MYNKQPTNSSKGSKPRSGANRSQAVSYKVSSDKKQAQDLLSGEKQVEDEQDPTANQEEEQEPKEEEQQIEEQPLKEEK